MAGSAGAVAGTTTGAEAATGAGIDAGTGAGVAAGAGLGSMRGVMVCLAALDMTACTSSLQGSQNFWGAGMRRDDIREMKPHEYDSQSIWRDERGTYRGHTLLAPNSRSRRRRTRLA